MALNTEVIVALITTFGVVSGVVGSIYAVRKTAQQTEVAAHKDEIVAADKLGIEGLKELAIQNRADREEWRKERIDLLHRMSDMEDRLTKLEQERNMLTRYVARLKAFITELGHVPPVDAEA